MKTYNTIGLETLSENERSYVEIKIAGYDNRNYWFVFEGNNANTLDNLLKMRVFYNQIEEVSLIPVEKANTEKAYNLHRLEAIEL